MGRWLDLVRGCPSLFSACFIGEGVKGRHLLVTASNVAHFPSRLNLGSVQAVQTGFPVSRHLHHGAEAEGSGSHRREDNVALT